MLSTTMSHPGPSRHKRPHRSQLWLLKPVSWVQQESAERLLPRTLGRMSLLTLGVGAIIGSGIFVLTGQAAAVHAGPAILVSFLIAAAACALAGLCYAELAASMPVSGSAYTYAYCCLGELLAWIMGWLLLLEYGIAAALVAVGWSGYIVSLLGDFGVQFTQVIIAGEPQPRWATSLLVVQQDGAGHFVLAASSAVNAVAAAGAAFITVLLLAGVRESARFNNVIVLIKLCVLVAFVLLALPYLDPGNWSPFIPRNTGRFGEFGWSGILRAAAITCFAYIGFEAVSTAGAEARNPGRDIPFGILGSLALCTLIYIAVAAALVGVVPFRQLGVPDPIAVAADRIHPHWGIIPWHASPHGQLNLFSLMIKIGAVAGLTSVMLVLCYAQTRIFYSMARDGLLPRMFASIHPERRTPWAGTLLLGVLVAMSAALLPLMVLTNLVSLGTALAFAIVCYAVWHLRRTQPNLPRAFRVPGRAWIPFLGMLVSLLMAAFNFVPMVQSALEHDPAPLLILTSYCLLGGLTYYFYGWRHSRLAAIASQAPDQALLVTENRSKGPSSALL